MRGYFSISQIVDSTGCAVSAEKARKYGWVTPGRRPHSSWGLGQTDIPLGHNLFVSGGRQCSVYALGFRSPISNWTIQNFGVGTGTSAPNMNDVQLQNAVTLSNGLTVKAIDGASWPAPFITRIDFTLGLNDANGYLLTEFGIFSGNSTLLARFTRTGLSKTSDWAPTIAYRLRC